MTRNKPWLRAISLLTCVFFATTDILKAELSVAMPVPTSASSVQSGTPVSQVEIPSALGELVRAYQGNSKQIVVIVQDAHANYEAQKNIAGILSHLADKNGLRTVNVEGAEGYLYHSFLSAYPSEEARRAMADYFMKEAKLTGPEYAAIVDRPDLKLFGVEEETLYLENRKVFLEALDYKGQDEVVLAGIRKLLESIGKKIFSKDLYDLIKRGEDFRRESKNLMAFIEFLSQFAGRFGVDLTVYAQISQFLNLNQIHGGMNEIEAEKESALLAAALKSSSAVPAGSAEGKDKFASLALEAKKQGLDLTAYPQAKLVLESLEIQKNIDVRLFDEVEKLNKALRAKLLQTDDEKVLEGLFRLLEIYEKIFDFSLTRDDADYFFTHRQDFQMASFKGVFARFQDLLEWNGGFPEEAGRIDADLARIEKFYELALRRDKILVDKTLSELKTDQEAVIALIAGGFHTAGFQRVLEEQGISHITVRPAITELKDADEQNKLYEESVRQEPEAFAQLLVRSRQKGQRLNDPRFQLSAHKLLFSQVELTDLLGATGREQLSQNLLALIEENPRLGANVTLAVFTVLMDIKKDPQAFDVQSRLDALLTAGEDLEFRRAVYGILLSDQTEIYQARHQKDALKVFGDRDVIVSLEPLRQRFGVTSREYGKDVADQLRRGAMTAVVDGYRMVIKTARDKIEKDLEKLKAGPVLVKAAPLAVTVAQRAEALPMAASLGSAAEKMGALKTEMQGPVRKLTDELASVDPSDAVKLESLANGEGGIVQLKKKYTNAVRGIFRALDKEGASDKTRAAYDREIQNLNTDLLILEIKKKFLDYRNQLLNLDFSDGAAWSQLSRRVDTLSKTFNDELERRIKMVRAQRPPSNTPAAADKQRRLNGLTELAKQFPIQHLTQLRHYVALLRAMQTAKADILSNLSESPQDWITAAADKRYGQALKDVRDADNWTPSVKDASPAVRAFVSDATQNQLTPSADFADFINLFMEAAKEVHDARDVVETAIPAEEDLIAADKKLTAAKEKLGKLIAFDLAGIPADRAVVIKKALKALAKDRTAVRKLYNAQAKAILEARKADEQKRKEAEAAQKKQEALARGKRLEEIRRLVTEEFLVDAEGIAAQLAKTGQLLAELDEMRSLIPRPALPETIKDFSIAVNQLAGLPETAFPKEKLEDIPVTDVREAVTEAASNKTTRKVTRGGVWTVVAKVAGKLMGWTFKGKKQPLSEPNREAVRIANSELPATRQPARPMKDFLQGEALPQMGNAQIMVQQSAAANILELLEKIWANTETPQQKRQEASETLIRQWVLRQTTEWSMAVDLDSKLANTGIFLRRDGKAYHIRNFDHDELLGMNSTGQLTREQFRKFFYYFWFVQANELRALDAKNNTQLEAVFHEAVKQSGIFKTLYENPANVELLRDTFSESFVRFQAREQAIAKRKQELKAIQKQFDEKKQALADLKAEVAKPGAPALGKKIDEAEEQLRGIKAQHDALAAQALPEAARNKTWVAYLDSLMTEFKVREEFTAFEKAQHAATKKTSADKADKSRALARVDDTILEMRTRRLMLEILQDLEQAGTWKEYGQWDKFRTLDEKISHLEAMAAEKTQTYYLNSRETIADARQQFNDLYVPFIRQHLSTELAAIVGDLNLAESDQEIDGLVFRYEALIDPGLPSSLASRFPGVTELVAGEASTGVLAVLSALDAKRRLNAGLRDLAEGKKTLRETFADFNKKNGVLQRVAAFSASLKDDSPASFKALSESMRRKLEVFYAQVLNDELAQIRLKFPQAKTMKDTENLLARLASVSSMAAEWEKKALDKGQFTAILSSTSEARSKLLALMFESRKAEAAMLIGDARVIKLDAALARLKRLDQALEALGTAADPAKDAELKTQIGQYRKGTLLPAIEGLEKLEQDFAKSLIGFLELLNDTLGYPLQLSAVAPGEDSPQAKLGKQLKALANRYTNELKGHEVFKKAMKLAAELLELRRVVINFNLTEPQAAKQGLEALLSRHDQIVDALAQIPQVGDAAKAHTGLREAIERRLAEPDRTVAAQGLQKRIDQARADLEALKTPAAGVTVTSAQVLALKQSMLTLKQEITDKGLIQYVTMNELDLLIDETDKLQIQIWISEQKAEIAKPMSLVDLQALQLKAMDVKARLDAMVFIEGTGDALKQSFGQLESELNKLVGLHIELRAISGKAADIKTRYAVKAAIADLKADEIAADKTAIDDLFAAARELADKVDKPRFGQLFTDLSAELTAVSDARVARSLARRFAAEIAAIAGADAAAQLKAIQARFTKAKAKFGVYSEDIEKLIEKKEKEIADQDTSFREKVGQTAATVRIMTIRMTAFLKSLETDALDLTQKRQAWEALVAEKQTPGPEDMGSLRQYANASGKILNRYVGGFFEAKGKGDDKTQKAVLESLNAAFQDSKVVAAIRATQFKFKPTEGAEISVQGAELLESFKSAWTRLVDSYLKVGTDYLSGALDLVTFNPGQSPAAKLASLESLQMRLVSERKLYNEDWGQLQAASLGQESAASPDKLGALGDRIKKVRLTQIETEIANIEKRVETTNKGVSRQLKSKKPVASVYRGMLDDLLFGRQTGKTRTPGILDQLAGFQADEIVTLVGDVNGKSAIGTFKGNMNQMTADCEQVIFRALEGWLALHRQGGTRLSEQDHQRVSDFVRHYHERLAGLPEAKRQAEAWQTLNARVETLLNETLPAVSPQAEGEPSPAVVPAVPGVAPTGTGPVAPIGEAATAEAPVAPAAAGAAGSLVSRVGGALVGSWKAIAGAAVVGVGLTVGGLMFLGEKPAEEEPGAGAPAGGDEKAPEGGKPPAAEEPGKPAEEPKVPPKAKPAEEAKAPEVELSEAEKELARRKAKLLEEHRQNVARQRQLERDIAIKAELERMFPALTLTEPEVEALIASGQLQSPRLKTVRENKQKIAADMRQADLDLERAKEERAKGFIRLRQADLQRDMKAMEEEERALIQDLRQRRTFGIGDEPFEKEWKIEAARARELAVKADLDKAEADLKTAEGAEKERLTALREQLKLRLDTLVDYHERVRKLMARVDAAKGSSDEAATARFWSRMRQRLEEALVRKTMEDRGEIRALEAELAALEKDKKDKLAANKKAEAQLVEPLILQVSGQLKALKEGLDRFVREHKERREDEELRDTVRDRVMADAKIPADEKHLRFFQELRKAQEELNEKRLRARADAGDEAARKELAKMLADRADLAKSNELRALDRDTRKKFDERFDAQVRAGERQPWELFYDWNDTWQKVLKEWYATKAPLEAAEKAKKVAEAELTIADNRFRWDMAKEREATESDIRKYGIEWELQPAPWTPESENSYRRAVAAYEADIAKMNKELETAGADRKKMLERLIAEQTAEIERLAARRDFAKAYHQEEARQKGPDARERMLDFREQWFRTRVAATANPTVKAELQAKLTALQSLIREVGEEKLKGRTIEDIEREDYLFKRMKRRLEGEIRVLNENLARWAEKSATLPADNAEKKGLDTRIAEQGEKRNGLENRLADLLVDHEWKVARMKKENELQTNPDRFTEMLKFEAAWLKTKIGELDAAAKKLEAPAKADPAVQRQLDITKRIKADKEKQLAEVEARITGIRERRRLVDELRLIDEDVRAGKISFSVAHLLREKAMLESKIREKEELAKKDPRVLDEIKALRRKPFTMDGFPYVAIDYPRFVDAFLVPWQKKMDALQAKLKAFDEKNRGKLLDKKVRADRTKIEEEMIALRLERLADMKRAIDRGDVEIVVPVLPPLTIDVSEATTENIREASDLVQKDTVSLPGPMPIAFTAEEMAQIDLWVAKVEAQMDADTLKELKESGRWWTLERWRYQFAKDMASRSSLLGADKQKLRLAILKEWNNDFDANLRVFGDPRFAGFRFQYRKIAGGADLDPVMEDSWRQGTEKKGTNLSHRLPLATLRGFFLERVAIEEINTFQNKLTVLRIAKINDWIRRNPIGNARDANLAFLQVMGQFYIANYTAQQAQLRSMLGTSPIGDLLIQARIQALGEWIGYINQGAQLNDSRLLAASLLRVNPLGVAPLPKTKGGRGPTAVAGGATDYVSQFIAQLNNLYEARNRIDASLDISYIRSADRYLTLTNKKGRTAAEDGEMLRLEHELDYFHAGKAPYHYNRRSSVNVLTWYLQHSALDEQNWNDLAEQQARDLLKGVIGMTQSLQQLGPGNAVQQWLNALQAQVGKEKGYTPNVIVPQKIQDIAASTESPILNNARIRGDLERLQRRLELMYGTYNKDSAIAQMARAFLEDFLVNDPKGLEKGITEDHLKFLQRYKDFFEAGGFDAFKQLYGQEYGDLLHLDYLPLFLSGDESKFNAKQTGFVLDTVRQQLSSFPPEDAIRISVLLTKIDMLNPNSPDAKANRAAYLQAINRTLSLSVYGSLDGTNDPGALQDKLRRVNNGGQAALDAEYNTMVGQLITLVGTYIRRDIQTTLVSQMREAEKTGIDTVRDVPDGRGGTKRGLLTKIQHDIQLRRNVELFLFGPKVQDGKMITGVPASRLNLSDQQDLALLNTLEKGMAERGISVDALNEILEKVAGAYGYDAKEKRVTYPFQEAIWELNERLNGRKEPRPFPTQGWAKPDKAKKIAVTPQEKREFVATVLSEAELYVQLGKDEYTKRRLELLEFLRRNPDAVGQTLAVVHGAVRDLKNAFRPDGKPFTPKAPKTFAEASGLERGMTRAILTAVARPGGNLERELNRMRLLTLIAKNKDHLRHTIDQAQEFYERILGPTTKLPLINPETILQDNLAFSRYADFLLMGVETWELPAPDAPAADIEKAVNTAIARWNADIRKLNEHLTKFPLDREIMINLAFLEVMAQKGWVPIGEFDFDTGKYKVERDQKEFEKFRRQLAKMNFDVYIAYVKQLLREGVPEAVPAPAVPAPGVPVFDGIFPAAPGLDAKDAARLGALPIPSVQVFPDGFLLDEQHAKFKWPVYVQREGKDHLVVRGYGRQSARGLIPGTVQVWNQKAKNYFPFHVAPRNKKKELDAFFGIEAGKAPLIDPAVAKTLASMLWPTAAGTPIGKLKLNEKAEQIVWRKSLDEGETWFDALVLRADGTLLLGNQEVSLGLAGPQYQQMRVQHVKTARVDDDGKLHIAMTVLGDRFKGDIFLTATFDEATGQTKVNIKSSYTVLRTGNAKTDEAIDLVLGAPVHQLTAVRLGATPQEHENITYHTVAGRVERSVIEPGVGVLGDSRRFGEVNETYAATLKRRDGTLIQVTEAPVAKQADQNPIEFRFESGNRLQMPGNIPVQLTVGTPVSKKIEAGSVLLSDITITSIPKAKAVKAADVKAPDIGAPAGWPVAAKPAAGAPVSAAVRQMREREAKTNALTERFFNERGLRAADDWYYALLYGVGPAAKKPDDKAWTPFMSYHRKDAAEQEKVRQELKSKNPEAYGRFRAFMSRAADIEEKDLDKTLDQYLKQNGPQIEILSERDKRRLMIASVIFNDLALAGNASDFVAGLRESDALKGLKAAMAKDKMALFAQVMRTEDQLKDVRLRESVPEDGKVWIWLDGVRYEVGLKAAGKFGLRSDDGKTYGPFDVAVKEIELKDGRKYDVVEANDKGVKLRAQGAAHLGDLLNYENPEARPGIALLGQMMDYFEEKLFNSPVLQGKLSSKAKDAAQKGTGVDEWNGWIKSQVDALLILRALGGAPAGAFLAPQDQKALVQHLENLRAGETDAVRFVQAFLQALPEDARPAFLGPEFQGALANVVQTVTLDDRFTQGLDVHRQNLDQALGLSLEKLQAALDQIGTQTDIQLTNMLLREQIASLTQQVAARKISGEPLLARMIDILDTMAQREESNQAARDARERLAQLRREIAYSHVGMPGEFDSRPTTELLTQLGEDLTAINVNLDSNLTDTLLRPLLDALGQKTEGVPAQELWLALAGKVQGMVYTQQVINLAGNMGQDLAAARLAAEQVQQETAQANFDMARFADNSEKIDALRQVVSDRSNGEVDLVATIPVIEADPLRGFAMLHLGKLLKDTTEPLPPPGVEIFLADGSNEDEIYTFDSRTMTLTFNLGKTKEPGFSPSKFYGVYRKSVRTVSATFQRNETKVAELNSVVTQSSGGTLSVAVSPRILADNDKTDYAVAQVTELLQSQKLPPSGTTIYVDDRAWQDTPSLFTSTDSTITLNLARIDNSPSEASSDAVENNTSMQTAYRAAVAVAGKEAVVGAASLGVSLDFNAADLEGLSEAERALVARIHGELLVQEVMQIAELLGFMTDRPSRAERERIEREVNQHQFEMERFRRNADRMDALRQVLAVQSGGKVDLLVSIPVMDDDRSTGLAVTQLGTLFQKGQLPPNGTTIFLTHKPDSDEPTVTYAHGDNTIYLNTAGFDESPSFAEAYNQGITAARNALSLAEAASLGTEESADFEGQLTPDQQEQLKAALDSKEEMSRISLLIALGIATSLKPINEPGLLVIQGDKYYSRRNATVLLDHVEGLLDSMTSQVIAISLDPDKIQDPAERQFLANQLKAYKGRVIVIQASLADSFRQLESMAQQMNLKASDFKTAMQFRLLDKQVPDQDLESALLNLGRYAAGRVVVLGDENLAAIEGAPIDITLGDLIKSWIVERAAEQRIAQAA